LTKQIKLRIYPDGIVQAEVAGIKGKKCTEYIGIIEKLLDAKVVDSEYTSEYYEREMIEIYEEENVKIDGGI
jgi:hypothetical protein